MNPSPKPTQADLLAAYGTTVPDILAANLNILFCGINPSVYSAAVGHHFARPGNRFWKTLHLAGFTDRLLPPAEDTTLLQFGYGVTNIADRATARADELDPAELVQGWQQLTTKLEHYRPRFLAILGVSAYRVACKQPRAKIGQQPERLHQTMIWVLPNPSGLNAHYQIDGLVQAYQELLIATQTG